MKLVQNVQKWIINVNEETGAKNAHLILEGVLGPIHTSTISYRSTSVRSKKWYGEGLRSHGYGKKSSGPSKTGPEIGRY